MKDVGFKVVGPLVGFPKDVPDAPQPESNAMIRPAAPQIMGVRSFIRSVPVRWVPREVQAVRREVAVNSPECAL